MSDSFFCLFLNFRKFIYKFVVTETNQKQTNMKNLTKLFVAVAVLIAGFACTTDATDDLGVAVGGQTEVAISLESSRTQLGEKADGVYPLYWSEGDKIAVNGVASNEVAAESVGKASATFVVNGALAYPYNIVYPAPAEGVSAVADGCYPVVFPATQTYVAGNVDGNAVPMYGYAEEGTTPTLNHLTGVLRFAVKGEATLASLAVVATNGALAGTYDVNCSTGALTAQEGSTSNTVSMSFGEGLTLGTEATPIYVAVPAGEYGEVSATLTTTTGEQMVVKFNTEGKPIAVGTVREFSEFTFAPMEVENDVFEISDIADMQTFAAKAETATWKEVKLVASIDMTGVEWAPVNYHGVFNGNKQTIKGLTTPLFATVSGTVKDLNLTDVNINETATPNVGAIARAFKAASGEIAQLLNCSAKGSIVVNCPNYEKVANTDAEFGVAGLVGYGYNLSVADCLNEVSIEVKQSLKSTATYNVYPCVGGIVGYSQTKSPSAEIYFLNNENKADILLAESSDEEGEVVMTTRLGGCVGNLDADYTLVKNCVNRGAVTQDKPVRNPYVGGVFGHTASLAVDECKNYGAVTFKGTTNNLYLGGVVGHGDTDQHFDACENHGAITTTAESTISAFLCGGILGNNTSSKDVNVDNRYVKNCTNKGDITISHTQPADENAGRFTIGGIVAWSQGYCDNNTNEGTITVNSTFYAHAKSHTSHCIGGIVGYKTVKQVTNCYSKGAIVVGGKMTSNADIKATNEAVLCIAGLIGYSTQTTPINYNEGCSVTVSGDYEALVYIGGFGGRLPATSELTNKAPITVTNTAKMKGLLMGGIAGFHEGKPTNDTNDAPITYYGDVNMTGIGDGTSTTGCTYFSIGGLIGRGTTNATNLVNTKNGVITMGGKFTASYNKKYGWTSVGGVVGTFSGGIHTKLYNYADMNIVLNIPNASWNEEPFSFGGVAGYVTNVVSEIHNYGNLNFSGTVKSDEPTRISGTIGRGSNDATHTYTNISNSGNLTVSVSSADHLYVAGICVQNVKSTYNNVVNKGNITVTKEAKSTDANIHVGGVFTTPNASVTSTGIVANTGKITVSGAGTDVYVGGCANNHQITGSITYVNTGDIEVNKPEGSTSNYYIGGVVGNATANLVGAKSYCTIRALGCNNVGMVMGAARAEGTVVASNCQLGGAMLGEYNVEDEEYKTEPLGESNFFNFIYGSGEATDWGTSTNYDGCTFLSAKPSIE